MNTEIRSAKEGFFSKILKNILPKKIKKLILVSSILAIVKKSKDPDMELIKKLNDVLNLAHDPNAFIFPMKINSFIWDTSSSRLMINNRFISFDEITKLELSSDDYAGIGDYFANVAPKWIKYADSKTISEDVTVLIKQIVINK